MGDKEIYVCCPASGNTHKLASVLTPAKHRIELAAPAPNLTRQRPQRRVGRDQNASGWYKSDVTVHFTCADALAGLAPNACPADQVLSSEGAAVASTAQSVSDLAGNLSVLSNVVTVQIDKTVPVVTVTGVSNGASFLLITSSPPARPQKATPKHE